MTISRVFSTVLALFICCSVFTQNPLLRFKTDTIYSMVVITSNDAIVDPIVIDLDNYCNTESLTDIDLWTFNMPDRFGISTMDTVFLLKTPYFGNYCAGFPQDSCVRGYIEITESGYTQLSNVPPNHVFNNQTSAPYSLGRIKIITAEQKLLFWIYPNENNPTVFKFYLHPSIYTYAPPPVRIYIGEYACDSLNLYEFSTPNNALPCDTLFVDGIRFTEDIIGAHFDSVFVPFETWLEYEFNESFFELFVIKDTLIFREGFNRDGCYYSETLYVTTYNPFKVYIPNAFTPDNSGKNDRFKPYPKEKPDKTRIQIFSWWGALIYDSESFSWSGDNYPSDTYVYLITLTYYGVEYQFKGSINLQR